MAKVLALGRSVGEKRTERELKSVMKRTPKKCELDVSSVSCGKTSKR